MPGKWSRSLLFSVVYSCSSLGEIAEWNSQTSEVVNSFTLKDHHNLTRIEYYRKSLYLCKQYSLGAFSNMRTGVHCSTYTFHMYMCMVVHFVAGTRSEVIVTTCSGEVSAVLSYQDAKPQNAIPVKISCFLILPHNQVWITFTYFSMLFSSYVMFPVGLIRVCDIRGNWYTPCSCGLGAADRETFWFTISQHWSFFRTSCSCRPEFHEWL